MQLLWFNIQEISFEACFVQFFFLHGFSFMESSVLLAMSFDHSKRNCHLPHTLLLLHPHQCGHR
jgi:olfactory receptor